MAKVMDWLSCTPYTLAANKYGSLPTNAFKPQKDCLTVCQITPNTRPFTMLNHHHGE